MKADVVVDALRLSGKLGHVFIATADAAGQPHMAAAGRLRRAPGDRLAVEAWFCPGTMENLQSNNRIAIVVWESDPDHGYQLVGEVEQVEDVAVLNGYAPELEQRPVLPQVERKLIVRVERAMAFTHAPHSDLE